jgi:O-antigen/teichoic acid export membrane protein
MIGIVRTIVLRMALTPASMGVYATVVSIQGFAQALVDMGLSTTTTRLGAEYLHRDERLAHAYFSWIHRLRMRMVPMIIILCILSAPILAWAMLGNLKEWYLIAISAGAVVPLSHIFATHQGILAAQKRFVVLSIWKVLPQLGGLVIVLILNVLGCLTIRTAVVSQVVALALACPVLSSLVPRRLLTSHGVGDALLHQMPDIRRVGVAQAMIGILYAAEVPFSYALLNHFVSSQEVAVYYGASMVAAPFVLLSGSFTNVLLPRLSRMTCDVVSIRRYAASVLVLLPVGLIIMLLAALLLPLTVTCILGRDYIRSLTVARILMAAYAPGVVLNALTSVLFPLRMERQQMWVSCVCFGFSVVLRVALASRGATGIAIALLCEKAFGWTLLLMLVFFGLRRSGDMDGLEGWKDYDRPHAIPERQQ